MEAERWSLANVAGWALHWCGGRRKCVSSVTDSSIRKVLIGCPKKVAPNDVTASFAWFLIRMQLSRRRE